MKQVWHMIVTMKLFLAIIIMPSFFMLSTTLVKASASESADGDTINATTNSIIETARNSNSTNKDSKVVDVNDDITIPKIGVAKFLTPQKSHVEKDNITTLSNQTDTNIKSEPTFLPDPFGRDTPRGTVEGFLQALSVHDDELASKYLQLTKYDNPLDEVHLLNKALNSGGRLLSDIHINNTNEGNVSDNLPIDIDNVGTISHDGKELEIQLIHLPSNDGNKIWLFSQKTVQKLPAIMAGTQPTLVEKYNIESLNETKFFQFYLTDIIAVTVIGLITFSLMYIFIWLLYLLISFIYPRISNRPLPLTDNIILPLVVMLSSILLPEMLVWAGVSVIIREPLTSVVGIFAWAPLTWLLVRVIDTIFSRIEQHSKRHKRLEQVAIIHLIRKLVKATLIVIAVIVIFGNLGFDLTTGIATLGIGGLALALGAQKTVENLVGSVVVVADQPVRVGDYCRFGQQTGFVIDIGIRSTRIQTLDRTIVTVPNGEFSSMKIENITARDMFSLVENLYLKRTAEPNVIHNLLRELDTFLNEHYLTNQEWNQVRIAELRQDCFVIECRAYVNANDMKEFFDKQNVILIDLLKQVEQYDVEHALPMQELVLNGRF